MEDNVKCPTCGSIVRNVKFCVQCGASLEGAEKSELPLDENSVPVPTDSQKMTGDPEIKSEMLVDYCRKTLATAMGDSYDEMVLGQAEDGTYQIDVYSKGFSGPEHHKLYKVPEQAKIDAYKYIEEHKLLDYENVRGFAMCGGDYVVKFKKADGSYARITTANLLDTNAGVLIGMSTILGGYVAKAQAQKEKE